MTRVSLVDSHAHLDDAAFDADRDTVIQNAARAGVDRILTVGVDLASSRRSCDLADRYDAVSVAVGIHPSRADTAGRDFAAIEELVRTRAISAIGEIGLDYGRCVIPRATQRAAFRAQLELASRHNLPVIVHDREAHHDVMADLAAYAARGVLHCFSGLVALADRAVELGLLVSLAGNVTYRRAQELHAVARHVPLSSMLVETDCPYLSPQEWRGRRNEPAHVRAVVTCIAGLRSETEEMVGRQTAANAHSLFRLRESPAGSAGTA